MAEQQLENKLIDDLVAYGYKRVDVKNIDSLFLNLRLKLEEFNGYKFSDEEFSLLKLELNKGSIFEKAKLLRSGYLLKQNDKTVKTIYFLNEKDWCKNIFEVTNQVKMSGKYNNRYDVTLLINGFPLVQIELKKLGGDTLSIIEGQINRYKTDSMKNSIFDFVQLFVISNGSNTKYSANNNKINSKFFFNYADFYNKKINNLEQFAQHFLEPCQLGKFITRYMVLSNDNGQQSILAMRSYQVHAVEKILSAFDDKVKNGYIWHTTGSGKTLTSFKTCEILSKDNSLDKVLFIVDRVDLDKQTVNEYKQFATMLQEDSIKEINSTKELIKNLNEGTQKIIVTTINKVENAVKKGKIRDNLNVALIFDECHRSQLGNMHKRIDQFFNNPFKIGFTGTPILAVNSKEGDNEYNTTEDVFGIALHKYLINDAIDDKNVLGFNIDYKSVINSRVIDEDSEISDFDTNILYGSKDYIKAVSTDIINTYDKLTRNKKFNAMLACDGINNAVKYYHYLNNMNYTYLENDSEVKVEGIDSGLKVACIFSYNDNEKVTGSKSNRELMIDIINKYNSDYNTNYSLDTYAEYKNNVANKVKKREIDLVIVSDMLLTGFDAKMLNTLYFDKKQQYHNLIQSISRTNRIYDETKEFGNIICYRPILENNINEALKLFSNPGSLTKIVSKTYDEQVLLLNEAVDELLSICPNVTSIHDLKGDNAKFEFLNMMKKVNRILNTIKGYRDFTYSDINNMSKIDIDVYQTTYRELYDEVFSKNNNDDSDHSILEDFAFEINLLDSVQVDYDFIQNLLSLIDKTSPEEKDNEIDRIIELVKREQKYYLKSELIERFLRNYYKYSKPIEPQYEEFMKKIIQEKVSKFSSDNEISSDKLKELVTQYKYNNDITSNNYMIKLNDITSNVSLLQKDKVRNNINEFITNLER